MNNDERPARKEAENDLKPMAPTSSQTIANTLVMRRLSFAFSPAKRGVQQNMVNKTWFSKNGSAKNEFSKK